MSEAAASLDGLGGWTFDWVWGLPLIVLTLIGHVVWLGILERGVVAWAAAPRLHSRPALRFVLVMSAAVLLAIVLHAVEALVWALAYVLLGALPDMRLAMLYSVGAQTSYGHAPLFLAPRWQMLGALEALVGVMLFGLTVAFLFSAMQRVAPTIGRRRGADIAEKSDPC